MKERIVAFGDAIIAIIITIIVLELPIELSQNGQLEMGHLFRAIAIYFISFCFVGDLWYQGAQLFSKIEKIRNKEFVVYMFFLFSLSLVPTFTRLLIEDTNQQVVLVYGLLSFIVTLLWSYLLTSLNKQSRGEGEVDAFLVKKERDRQIFFLSFRVVVLVIAYIFPTFGLIIYLILPISGFLQNMVDREEDAYVSQMNDDQKNFYLQDRRQPMGRSLKRYREVLASSLNDDSAANKDSQWWLSFNQNWNERIGQQLAQIDQEIAEAQNEHEKRRLEQEKNRLIREQGKIKQSFERKEMNKNRINQKREGRKPPFHK